MYQLTSDKIKQNLEIHANDSETWSCMG